MNQTDNNKVIAVRVAGRFAEFYSPFFSDPYEDNAEYRAFYDEHILPVQPVLGPCLGDGEHEYLTGDLTCLAERLACDCGGSEDTGVWEKCCNDIADAIEAVLKSGEAATHVIGGLQLVITPYRRGELPPIKETHLKVYGKYADLIRERVAAI